MKMKKYDQQSKTYTLLSLLVLFTGIEISGMNKAASFMQGRSTKMSIRFGKKQHIDEKKQHIDKLVNLVKRYFMDDTWKNLSEKNLESLVDQYKECMKFIDLGNDEQDRVAFNKTLSDALNVPGKDIDIPYEQMKAFEYSIFGDKLIDLIETYLINDRWKNLNPDGRESILQTYSEYMRFIPMDTEKEAQAVFNQKLAEKGLNDMQILDYYRAIGRFEGSSLY
jgi:hypothetical protein